MKDPIIEVTSPSVDIQTPEDEIKTFPKRIELAGRTCYKSEDRITEDSAEKFVKMLCRRGHESVLEHCVITVRFVCSRATSHQMVRHRIAAYSQESMRYCNYGKRDALKVIPPAPLRDVLKDGDRFNFRGSWAMDGDEVPSPSDVQLWISGDHWVPVREGFESFKARRWAYNALTCYQTYLDYLDEGWKPEDARYNLPIGTKTEVVSTYNLRQWRHVFTERALNDKAQFEIRDLMGELLERFTELLPSVFGGLGLGA